MIKLSEYLFELEFDYKINDNNTLSLIDLTGANLANIEQEEFEINEKLAEVLSDRLSVYEEDYHFSGIIDTLRYDCQYKDDIYPYDTKLIEAMKLYPTQFDSGLIDFIRDIATYNLDISEVFENLKINKKCFRCNTRLKKSELPDYAYTCPTCNEDFIA